jgi:hypothetical protein
MGLLDNYVIPEVWAEAMPFTIPTKSKILGSPAVKVDPNPPFQTAGVFTHQPVAKEPTGRWEKPSSADLTSHALTQYKDTMVCITRQIDYTVTEQVIRLSGTDLGQELFDNVAGYIAKRYELTLMDILQAIYGTGGTLNTTHTIEESSPINFNTIFKGKALLGDNADQLAMSAYHSQVVNHLRNNGMITDMSNWKEEQVTNGMLQKVAGLPIIETDLLPQISSKYLSLLLGNNSIYFANPYFNVRTWEYPKRNGGEIHIIITSDYCIHIPGVRYTLNDQEPSDTVLATPATWQKVADHNQDIKLIALLTPAMA